MTFRALIVVCAAVLLPSLAPAQALTSLSSVRVGYVTRKNTVKPQGELEAQIDALDAQIAEASRLGKNGELRRLFAKGIALLNNRPWTDAVEYSTSLVLRTDRVVVDSSKPDLVRLETANEIMPYRTYVPKAYNGSKPFPLIIALHGLGGTEDSFFDNYGAGLPPLAESHGYILATPLGYRVDGSYGWGLGNPPADPATRRTQDFSEQDVMQVRQRMRQIYKIDESRIYLMGHSMGAIGTWKIAPKYPDIWAAIAPISGSGAAATLEKIRSVPEIVVHGDADPTVPVTASRAMVAKLKELGVEHKYVEVPGGLHSDVVGPSLAAVIDFFDAHKKAARSTSQQ